MFQSTRAPLVLTDGGTDGAEPVAMKTQHTPPTANTSAPHGARADRSKAPLGCVMKTPIPQDGPQQAITKMVDRRHYRYNSYNQAQHNNTLRHYQLV